MAYYRAQVLLDPEQHARLRRIAEARGVSISEVVREIVDIGLEHIERERDARLRALDDLARLGDALERAVGRIPADIVRSVREERDARLHEIVRGGDE